MPLFPRFLHALTALTSAAPLTGRPLIAAVSGGPDSLALLHLLRRATKPLGFALHVATLDHGLRGAASAADAAFVADLAVEWGLPVQVGRADVPALMLKHALGVEAAARRARYTFLAEAARQAGAPLIATGHTADDQAETVLLHLIRGAGLVGLGGMRPFTPLSADHLLPDAPAPRDLWIARPLLDFTRAEIEAYCAAHGLQARKDTTNAELTTARNRLRHVILPQLEAFNPAIRATLARTARVIADDYAFLNAQSAALWDALLLDQTADRLRLDRARFRDPALAPAMQRAALRRAVSILTPPGVEVSLETLDAALYIAQQAPNGRQATLPAGVTLTVTPDALSLARADAPADLPPGPWIAPETVLAVPIPGEVRPPETPWVLHTRWLAPGEDAAALRRLPFTATLALPSDAGLTLRTRRPGDRFRPLGMGGHRRKLSDVWIDAQVPAAWRARLPLLVVGDEIGWISLGKTGQVAAPFEVSLRAESTLVVTWETAEQTISAAAYGN